MTIHAIRHALSRTQGAATPVSPRLQRLAQDGRPLPRPAGPPPGQTAVDAAVLILLYHGPCGITTLLTRRNDQLRKHAGQIAFPGGRVDRSDGSLYAAALREAAEEVNISPQGLELLAGLAPVYVPPTNFLIHPFVAYSDQAPSILPNEAEVAEVLPVPLSVLLDPASVQAEVRELAEGRYAIPFFRYQGHKIWGATAIMIDQLLTRLEAGEAGEPAAKP